MWNSGLFGLILVVVQCYATPREDVCRDLNGRRLYLEYGEQGVLEAANVTFQSVEKQNNAKNQTTPISGFKYKQCSLELVTCPSCSISLNFSFINLPNNCDLKNSFLGTQCACDYVWISEPPFSDSSGKLLCGSGTDPYLFKSQTRSVAITFMYSRSMSKAFVISYRAGRNRQFLNLNHESSLNDSQHILSSPFFPNPYPRDFNAEYVLNCPSSNCRLRLSFTDFLLATMSIVEFFDWNGQRLEVTTGSSFRPPIIISTGPSLVLRFYANGGTGLGFKATFSAISNQIEDSELSQDIDCGGLVDNLGGAITMMNMIAEGTKAFDCFWIIQPPENYLHIKTHLYLKVITFEDLAGSTELIVRQGVTSDKPAIEVIQSPISFFVTRKQQEHIIPIASGFYVSLRGIFGPHSRLAIVYTAFSYKDCFSGSDFLCQNHRCVPFQLKCDGFDHCGDNSDEPPACFQGDVETPTNKRWYSRTPNYYFPKIDRYSDLKTATMIFIGCSLGLTALISALLVLLYRMNTRARRQRELQNHLQTISDLLEEGNLRSDDASNDDPPIYEAPPDYSEVIKIDQPIVVKRKRKKTNCDANRGKMARSKHLPSHIEPLIGVDNLGQCSSPPISIEPGCSDIPDSPPPSYGASTSQNKNSLEFPIFLPILSLNLSRWKRNSL